MLKLHCLLGVLVGFFCFIFGTPSLGLCRDLVRLSGHLKYQNTSSWFPSESLAAQAGPRYTNSHQIDLRGLIEVPKRTFSWVSHVEYLGNGSNARFDRFDSLGLDSSRLLRGLPNDDRRLLPLTAKVQSDNHYRSVLRFDRAYVNYASGMLAFRVGRQAISWGNGLVFQALDVFNPFSPTEVDKDYKSGDDMAWGQVLFDSGADLQGLIVPRRHPETESVLNSESSYALRYRARFDSLAVDYELLGASHYDEWVIGVGASRSIVDAVARSDVLFVDSAQDGSRAVWLLNIDRSWVIYGVNVYTFVEYFRNNFGVGSQDYTEPSNALLERLDRGEFYTLGKDYMAIGGFVEVSPLQKINLSSFFNMHDDSSVVQLRHEYDLAQDFLLTLGGNFYFGSKGSEFGGIRIPPTDVFLSPGQSLYLRLSAFF